MPRQPGSLFTHVTVICKPVTQALGSAPLTAAQAAGASGARGALCPAWRGTPRGLPWHPSPSAQRAQPLLGQAGPPQRCSGQAGLQEPQCTGTALPERAKPCGSQLAVGSLLIRFGDKGNQSPRFPVRCLGPAGSSDQVAALLTVTPGTLPRAQPAWTLQPPQPAALRMLSLGLPKFISAENLVSHGTSCPVAGVAAPAGFCLFCLSPPIHPVCFMAFV